MAEYKVVITDDRHTDYEIEKRILSAINAELTVCDCATANEVMEACKYADGVLLNMAPMPKAVIQALEKCKVISRYGVGYDNVDVSACTQAGIQVTNVPDYCMDDVSELAIALMLDCCRQVSLRDRKVRLGEWNINSHISIRMAGKTLGVFGAGRIAQSLIQKARGLGITRVLAYDPYMSEEDCAAYGAQKADMVTVMRESDFISLHMPATDETTGIINASLLSYAKPTAILVNTARGPLVDDDALIQALKEKKILFAGLDTHHQEPICEDSEYLRLDNCVLTDHTGYNTEEAVADLKSKAAMNVLDVLIGKKPEYAVNRMEDN